MKVAIYARVSSEKQEKEETITSQVEASREFVKKNEHFLVDEYLDNGYSGELLARPELDRLRDDVAKGVIEAIIIHSPDRLSRKYIHFGLLLEEFKKRNIQVLFLDKSKLEDTPENKLLEQIQGAVAEYEKEKILERTRRGRIHKAKRGVVLGGRSPYGYTYVRGDKARNKDGHYILNKKEAKIVQLIFDLLVNRKMSIRGICVELTNRGIKPRLGKHWRTSSIHKMLRNETYTGTTHYNKNKSVEGGTSDKYYRRKNNILKLRPKSEWVPIELSKELIIIDKAIFERASKVLIRNSELSKRNTKYEYLLGGLMKCGNCGAPFGGDPCHGKLYYRCKDKNRKFPLTTKCKVPSISAEKIEGVIWDELSETLTKPRILLKYINKLNKKKMEENANIEEQIADIDEAIEKTKTAEDRLIDAYREELLSMDRFKDEMTQLKAQQDKLSQDKQMLLERAQNRFKKGYLKEKVYLYCKAIKKRLKRLTFDEKREILTQLVSKIAYYGEKVIIRGIIPVEEQASTVSVGDFESITSGCYERKSDIEFELEVMLR